MYEITRNGEVWDDHLEVGEVKDLLKIRIEQESTAIWDYREMSKSEDTNEYIELEIDGDSCKTTCDCEKPSDEELILITREQLHSFLYKAWVLDNLEK